MTLSKICDPSYVVLMQVSILFEVCFQGARYEHEDVRLTEPAEQANTFRRHLPDTLIRGIHRKNPMAVERVFA
ncbi:MAG TPA: hypothetical protein DIV98_05885, partial [Oceanicaulis sp.]|nr:hypothetical protein [Oceanicaulis sp.]